MKNILVGIAIATLFGGPAVVASQAATPGQRDQKAAAASSRHSSEMTDARDEVRQAATVAKKMMSQPEAKKLLQQSKGVFLVPDYGRGALLVGGSGGQGVLVEHENGRWSDPVFYNLGSVSVGLQAGGSGGQIAMILMTDKALNSFKGNNTFSLNANAGLSIVNYSARGQASAGKADVVLWSDTKGAYAGASFSASDISADEEANRAYYGTSQVNPTMILSGAVSKERPVGTQLKEALSE